MDPLLPDRPARASSSAWWLGALLLLGSCATGPTAVPDVEVGAPRSYHARVVRASGNAPAATGDACAIAVTHVRGPYFNCRVRITCGGDLVYGLPDAGYNRCGTRGDGRLITAVDDDGTRADGDPSLRLDLERGTASIRDEDPDMDLELTVDDPVGGTAPPVVPPGYDYPR